MKTIRSFSYAAAFLSATFSAAILAAPFELPPLVAPATTEHHVGKMVWLDLMTPDIAGAKKFYSGLFGWTFKDVHAGKGDYAVALLDGRPVGGLFQQAAPAGEGRRPTWLSFFAVRDVEATERTALENGAKIVREAKTYPQRGRQAVLSDPQGAVFAILASSSGDPSDFLAMPGEWIWSSLHAQDADKDAAFYQTVFGYDVFDLPSDDESEHVILSSDDFARASVNTLPADAARRHPHWLNFVRVENAAASAAKAVALGGRILVEPRVDRHGGNIAVVADPTGAPFGLMEWTDTDTKKEPK
jgi:uncharacterized protein